MAKLKTLIAAAAALAALGAHAEIAVTDDQGRRCSTIRITNMIKDR